MLGVLYFGSGHHECRSNYSLPELIGSRRHGRKGSAARWVASVASRISRHGLFEVILIPASVGAATGRSSIATPGPVFSTGFTTPLRHTAWCGRPAKSKGGDDLPRHPIRLRDSKPHHSRGLARHPRHSRKLTFCTGEKRQEKKGSRTTEKRITEYPRMFSRFRLPVLATARRLDERRSRAIRR